MSLLLADMDAMPLGLFAYGVVCVVVGMVLGYSCGTGAGGHRGAAAEELSTAVLSLAYEITSALFEEAMREHGITPKSIKLVGANARANLSRLDHIHASEQTGHSTAHPTNRCARFSAPDTVKSKSRT